MEQLLIFVVFSLLAPLPGRKKNICRPCLCALAGSVTLSLAFLESDLSLLIQTDWMYPQVSAFSKLS